MSAIPARSSKLFTVIPYKTVRYWSYLGQRSDYTFIIFKYFYIYGYYLCTSYIYIHITPIYKIYVRYIYNQGVLSYTVLIDTDLHTLLKQRMVVSEIPPNPLSLGGMTCSSPCVLQLYLASLILLKNI